jgi:hypothetical protein
MKHQSAAAFLAYRESLRDIECCLRAMREKLYHTPPQDEGILMTVHPDEPCQTFFSCFHEGFESTTGAEYLGNIFFCPHIMDLPQIEVVRLHVAGGFFVNGSWTFAPLHNARS